VAEAATICLGDAVSHARRVLGKNCAVQRSPPEL
jgi:hypothetical protein